MLRSISRRCPPRPNPVTSVQPLAPCLPQDSDRSIIARQHARCSAASTSRPLAARAISAASKTPVPSAFVRISRSPGRAPPLRHGAPSRTVPLIVSPTAISAPSAVCPPIRTAPASPRPRNTPRSSCSRSRSTMPGAANGRVTETSAETGAPPMAWISPMQWLAAIRPNRYGSSIKARNWSTVWYRVPSTGGASGAASSGHVQRQRPARFPDRRAAGRAPRSGSPGAPWRRSRRNAWLLPPDLPPARRSWQACPRRSAPSSAGRSGPSSARPNRLRPQRRPSRRRRVFPPARSARARGAAAGRAATPRPGRRGADFRPARGPGGRRRRRISAARPN